jgi:hypothetical protein
MRMIYQGSEARGLTKTRAQRGGEYEIPKFGWGIVYESIFVALQPNRGGRYDEKDR